MNDEIYSRILIEADIMLKTKKTVRDIADELSVSKTTVHKDMSVRLYEIAPEKAVEIHKILLEHKRNRHIKGGMATKLKYEKKKFLLNESKGVKE